jgi:hypothetical protein
MAAELYCVGLTEIRAGAIETGEWDCGLILEEGGFGGRRFQDLVEMPA